MNDVVPPRPSAWHTINQLMGEIRGYWLAFSLAIFGNILYGSVDATFTYVFKPILDKGFVERDQEFIAWIPFILIGLFLLRGIGNFLSSVCMTWVGRSVVMQFRKKVFNHLLQMPARHYDKRSSGELLSTIIYNVEQLAGACTDALTVVVQSGFMVLGLFIVMFINSWQLTCIFTITIPVIALIVKISSNRMRHLSVSIQRTVGDVTHIAEEGIEGYKVVRTFGGRVYEAGKFALANKQNRRQEMKVIVTRALGGSSVQMVAAIALAITLYLVTMPDSAWALSAGSFTSLVMAMFAMLKPMKNLTQVNSVIQKGLAAASSIFDLLDSEIEQDTGTKTLERAKGAIVFQNVMFAYEEGQTVLCNIQFEAMPGQTIALVGRSGSGKSTLVNLLPRFYEIGVGSITIDGIDIRELTLDSLRAQIALVSQEVVLFNDTIAGNIAYGSLQNVSQTALYEAAKDAGALEFITAMPDGFDTQIGDKGVLLSGGQRQRLAIARALLKDAPILILDEATSSLDTTSEREIQSALQTLMKARTTLVIAHRLSTIENADLILVMDKGRIVERGQHQRLLALGGHYTKLYDQKFSEVEV